MLYFSRGRIVNNSLQTSNLRQGNIKLLVASWAPLRYYFNRPSEVSAAMGEWATVNFCPCIYCVNWYQKSTIVLLNGLSSIILVHKNTPSNQNILIKVGMATSTRLNVRLSNTKIDIRILGKTFFYENNDKIFRTINN